MLVLARRERQRIMIGDDVVLEVIEVRRDGKVRLGFSAPAGVIIDREEVYLSKKAEGREGGAA